jgi:bifunctional non-homologous end joining protein LigD
MAAMSLREYARKRRFDATPEPAGDTARAKRKAKAPIFVVQLHHASVRHYDFRLEIDGALKSWAVPKGPSLRPGERRLAVEVEDHPLSYAGFAGDIPEGNYGAGHVDIFDSGTWEPLNDPRAGLAAGKLDFVLHGGKLRGGWKLVRTARPASKPQWLLFKRNDAFAADVESDQLVDTPPPANAARSRRPGGRDEPRRVRVAAEATPRARVAAQATPRRVATEATPRRTRDPAAEDWRAKALALPGARPRPLAVKFEPMLCGQREDAPRGDEWLHEVKWDGYRMLADLDGGKVRLRSRKGLDWTRDFAGIARALEALPVEQARFDGELVVLDDEGRSDFARLQRALDGSGKDPLRYLLFDLPGVAGIDLTATPLLERKRLLEALLEHRDDESIAYSRHIVGHGEKVFAASAGQGLEGIISKRVDSVYEQRRSNAWVKVKHEDTDEFVVVGFTGPKGSRTGFGSLLMAVREAGKLRYVGRVGTGYDDATLSSLHRQLKALATDTPTVAIPGHVALPARSIHWVRPQLVAEVAFRGWGKEGLLRQAAFKRLREDKAVDDLGSGAPPEVAITSPDRVVYKESGITKGQVADYYRAIADWILPELANRPLSLVRCPSGASGPCFFQKHHAGTLGAHVQAIPLRQKSGKEDYLFVRDAAGLLELVQMNTLEFHPWGSRVETVEQPDRLVFDLDPDVGIDWKQIVAAARDVRARLADVGLESFVRLSGGKGLHVVVPVLPEADWEQAKDFCEAFAQAMVAHAPDRYIATMSKAKRAGKIFIDWLRNGRGATSVTSWSLRARPGAPVAMPLRWEELGRMKGGNQFDLHQAKARAARLSEDPWRGIETLRQRLPQAPG